MSNRAQDGVLLAARFLMAAALVPTGVARALNVSGFALTLAAAGVPAPNAVATLAVVVEVFGPLALILGVMPRLTGFAMAAFVGLFAALLHPFWFFSGANAVIERSFLIADLGLAGAFLIYAVTGPGALSWQGWRASATAMPVRQTSRSGGKAANGNRPARRHAKAAA